VEASSSEDEVEKARKRRRREKQNKVRKEKRKKRDEEKKKKRQKAEESEGTEDAPMVTVPGRTKERHIEYVNDSSAYLANGVYVVDKTVTHLNKVYERGAALHFQGKEGTCLTWWLVDLGTWGREE
jgi:hypothetical protein